MRAVPHLPACPFRRASGSESAPLLGVWESRRDFSVSSERLLIPAHILTIACDTPSRQTHRTHDRRSPLDTIADKVRDLNMYLPWCCTYSSISPAEMLPVWDRWANGLRYPILGWEEKSPLRSGPTLGERRERDCNQTRTVCRSFHGSRIPVHTPASAFATRPRKHTARTPDRCGPAARVALSIIGTGSQCERWGRLPLGSPRWP